MRRYPVFSLALLIVLMVGVAIYWPQLHTHLAASHFCKR